MQMDMMVHGKCKVENSLSLSDHLWGESRGKDGGKEERIYYRIYTRLAMHRLAPCRGDWVAENRRDCTVYPPLDLTVSVNMFILTLNHIVFHT